MQIASCSCQTSKDVAIYLSCSFHQLYGMELKSLMKLMLQLNHFYSNGWWKPWWDHHSSSCDYLLCEPSVPFQTLLWSYKGHNGNSEEEQPSFQKTLPLLGQLQLLLHRFCCCHFGVLSSFSPLFFFGLETSSLTSAARSLPVPCCKRKICPFRRRCWKWTFDRNGPASRKKPDFSMVIASIFSVSTQESFWFLLSELRIFCCNSESFHIHFWWPNSYINLSNI